MPNWCDNSVTLRHEDVSKVDALAAELSKEGNGEMFNHLRPNPAGEWQYDWSCENWGTKWDASIIDWERRDENEIWVSMNTAWSPPVTLYNYLVEQGWDVSAVYYEPGMGYGGVYEDGDDDYYEFDWTNRDSIENLPNDLIEFGDLLTQFDEYERDRIQEDWADAERTEWFEPSVKPVRDGYYEITTEGWDYPQLVRFENDEWQYYAYDIKQWRGLAQDPNDTIDPDNIDGEIEKMMNEFGFELSK